MERKKLRKPGWCYANPGIYFITIGTKDKIPYFGSIKHEKLNPSLAGAIASVCWYDLNLHFKGIISRAFVIMPDHLHALIEIRPGLSKRNPSPPYPFQVRDGHDRPVLEKSASRKYPVTLSTVIGCYKSAVSKHCKILGIEFSWHRSFHDIIVPDDLAFQKIKSYIQNNPKNWEG